MQFNDETSDQGLLQDITFWTGADKGTADADSWTAYTLKDRTRNCNFALDKVCALILQADGKWKWDDTNHTDLPIGKTNLVADQQDYGVTGATFLKITEVQRLNDSGTYETLTPVVEDSPEGKAILKKKQSGDPKYYVKKANSVFLGPIPDSALTNGLRIFFQRDVHYFVTTDTTAEPGFAQPFHRLISLYPSRDWLMTKGMREKLAEVKVEIKELKAALLEFYSSRDADQRIRMQLRGEDYGAENLKIEGGEGRPAVDWE